MPWQLIGKTKKFFLSGTIRPRAQIFGMQHPLMYLYQDCSNYGQYWPYPEGHLILHKIFSETIRPRAQIFDVPHPLVDLYQDCSNNDPRVTCFYVGLYRENLKNSSYLKHEAQSLDIWCVSFSGLLPRLLKLWPQGQHWLHPRSLDFTQVYIGNK